ncbi:hypothetical protein L3Q82_005123 [Scortum barcoo]|uniref:Uncharacterized protein n=1 Tax=Scortum barcoo TaxID=214431 RepID=A0ACB8VE02_9TELE|nr:hypothetical protein L3Q82_005123 [Scortum barcoo]
MSESPSRDIVGSATGYLHGTLGVYIVGQHFVNISSSLLARGSKFPASVLIAVQFRAVSTDMGRLQPRANAFLSLRPPYIKNY